MESDAGRRLGRRTARTFPLPSPPQKNRSPPSDSSPDTLTPSGISIQRRAAEGFPDRLPGLVDDLKSEAELIITNSYAAARVVKDRSNIPVVAITGADPVATGLIVPAHNGPPLNCSQ